MLNGPGFNRGSIRKRPEALRVPNAVPNRSPSGSGTNPSPVRVRLAYLDTEEHDLRCVVDPDQQHDEGGCGTVGRFQAWVPMYQGAEARKALDDLLVIRMSGQKTN